MIAISRAVADELLAWLDANRPQRLRPLQACYWQQGADLQASAPSQGLPAEADIVLNSMQARPSFLMLGTMEPRKGYSQVLSAFEQLWADDVHGAVVEVPGQLVFRINEEGVPNIKREMRLAKVILEEITECRTPAFGHMDVG